MSRSRPFKTFHGVAVALPFYLGLFAYVLVFHRGFAVMGVKNPELTRITDEYFQGDILFFQAKILLAYAFCALLVGLFTGALVKNTRELLLPGLTWRQSAVASLALTVVIHVVYSMMGIGRHPQLYVEFFYDRGGFWKAFQLFCTDTLTPGACRWFLRVILIAFHIILFSRLGRDLYRRGLRPLAAGAALLSLAVLGLLAARESSLPIALDKTHPPNLLVVAGDSIRPDRLGYMGYGRPTSPALDGLAAKGAVFENAYAQLPRTFPSWLSFLTGDYPFQHGITTMFPSVAARQHEFATLATVLRDQGYRTGVVSDFAGDIFPRAQLGFQDVHAPNFNFQVLTRLRGLEIHTPLLPYFANAMGRKVFPELREFAALADPGLLREDAGRLLTRYAHQERPFFMLVFFSATHFPYAPPYPYYRTFTDPAYTGAYKYMKPNLINLEQAVTAEDQAQVGALFDGAIRATDDAIAELLDQLKVLGLADNTVVVYVSDHGENLYERDYGMGHGEHLRGPYALRFPWIIADPRPGAPAGRFRGNVRSVDFAPTLLDLLGAPPLPQAHGQSLLPRLRGQAPDSDLPVYAETGLWFIDQGKEFFQKLRLPYPDVTFLCKFEPYYHSEIVLKDQYRDFTETAKHRMWVQDGWKIIYVPLREGIRWELYDLAHDPEETTDLAGREPQKLLELQTALLDFLRTREGWTVRDGFFVPREAP